MAMWTPLRAQTLPTEELEWEIKTSHPISAPANVAGSGPFPPQNDEENESREKRENSDQGRGTADLLLPFQTQRTKKGREDLLPPVPGATLPPTPPPPVPTTTTTTTTTTVLAREGAIGPLE